MTPALLSRLRELLGEDGVLTRPDAQARYLVDERRLYQGCAAAVLLPSSVPQLAAAMACCHAAGIHMVPQGGNTGYCGGATPDESGREVVISLERLRRVRALDAEAFTLTAEAGLTLAEVQAAAGEAGLLFPLSMGSEASCQLGGVLSTNAGGLAVLRYGTARDLVLGLEVVLPDGRLWDGLTALRKDNTGYDLKQWFVGAEGTLGIITAAVLKLFPRPSHRATVWVGVPDLTAAVRLLALLRERVGDVLTSFEYLSATSLALLATASPDLRAPPVSAPGHVLLEAGFFAERGTALETALLAAQDSGLAVDAVVAHSETQRADFWRLRERIPAAEKALGGSLKHDVSVPLSALPILAQQASQAIAQRWPQARISVYGHVGDGNLHFNVLAPGGETAEAFRAREGDAISALVHGQATALAGSFSAEHGVGRLKRELLAASESPVALGLMRALKRALDPRGLMNPGKILTTD